MTAPSTDPLLHENQELRRRLEEAEDVLRAIRGGEVDAVLVGAEREQVFTLERIDRPYRLLVEGMTQGAATLSSDGVILYCNRHFADLLGKKIEALLGQPCIDLVSPNTRPLFEALLREGQAGSGSQAEVTLERQDGATIPVYLGVNALREGAAGLCLMITDLSEQKRHEAIAASEALAHSILEQAVDAIVVCDEAGKVIRASQGAHRLCGQNPLLLPFDAAFPLRPVLPGPILGGTPLRGVEVYLDRPDGRRLDLLLSAGPLRDPGGRLLGAVVTLTDITGRKQMEEALRQARDHLEQRVQERTAELKQAQESVLQTERLAAIGQMVAGLAHESRNALQRIQACLSVLVLRLEDRPDCLPLLNRMQNAQDDLGRLYEEVRQYASPIPLDHRLCRLAEVWREAWDELGPQRAGRRAELREASDGDDACVADPFRLKQVFRNLLENALAAAADPVQVEVHCTRTPWAGREAVRVVVRDNGPGFAPEQRAKVFDPFYTTKVQGTGLGLAICKRIVEAHGGQLEAGVGPGGEILIILPRGDV